MSTNTPNFNLEKPSVEEFYDVGVPNSNMDKIDNVLKKLSDDVHGLSTIADVTYYVNANGKDTNNGLTTTTAFKSIVKAISKIPQIVNHNVTINIAEGNYNETLNLYGILGGSGTVNVLGSTTLTDTHIVSNIIVNRVQVPVVLRGLKFSSANSHGLLVSYSTFVSAQYLKDVTPSTFDGIHFLAASGRVYSCELSNKATALHTETCANVYSETNTGTGNSFGLVAYNSSKIGKAGTQPVGITNESKSSGGDIL
ncbi:hypothetical protein AMS59_12690 [Lysinibacillus sp. FJAT-14745]|uniref:hypothetical protein n=1 Tax=Lysinibacillus sp. FJAT-14745 TaxID=1704289 RepID=UPI0006AB86E9|nr:hypothetical protein [Lysinibacillus sp. FJAT-14745]KOP78666.1 hypothetical protein AMS59_12690 [Lysinibacillus sp. FJAT-14745]